MPDKEEKSEVHKGMLTNVPTGYGHDSVQHALETILKPRAKWESLNYLYVLNKEEKLVGVASIKELLQTPKRQLLKKFKKKMAVAHETTSQQTAASRVITHNIKSLPVVDKKGKFLGVIGTDEILDTMEKEHVKSVLTLSGINADSSFVDVIAAKISTLIRWRAPWLIAGLCGGVVSTFIIGNFEDQLSEIIALAFFIPVIVYMGSAIGAQTQTIFIRNLALRHLKIRLYFIREVIVDVAIAGISAMIIYPIAAFLTDSTGVALVVSLSLLIVMSVAGSVAIIIPTIMNKLKIDPSIAGGPFTTIIQDLINLAVYFWIANLVLF